MLVSLELIFYIVAFVTFVVFLILLGLNMPMNSRALVFLASFAVFALVALFSAFSVEWSELDNIYTVLVAFSLIASFCLTAVAFWTYRDEEEIRELKSKHP